MKIKKECSQCQSKEHLFIVEFESGTFFYCNMCLSQVLLEKPFTVAKIFQVDNKYYDIEFKKEVEKNGNENSIS
jgi:hypothetical protein